MGIAEYLPETQAELLFFISDGQGLYLSYKYAVADAPGNVKVGLVGSGRARLYREASEMLSKTILRDGMTSDTPFNKCRIYGKRIALLRSNKFISFTIVVSYFLGYRRRSDLY